MNDILNIDKDDEIITEEPIGDDIKILVKSLSKKDLFTLYKCSTMRELNNEEKLLVLKTIDTKSLIQIACKELHETNSNLIQITIFKAVLNRLKTKCGLQTN